MEGFSVDVTVTRCADATSLAPPIADSCDPFCCLASLVSAHSTLPSLNNVLEDRLFPSYHVLELTHYPYLIRF